ncbi:MAG: hypothetical protein C0600_14945 [Ignavibacteria bacterium]|nr:MAG: hypothetical protein C0600_14945 [Ignavibacteria bacterium]
MKTSYKNSHIILLLIFLIPLLAKAEVPEEGNAAVELSQFSAVWIDNIIALSWNTTVERNNLGFEIERRGQFDIRWSTVGFVRGSGRDLNGRAYSYTEHLVPDKVMMYRIRQVTNDGRSLVSPALTLVPNGLSNSFCVRTANSNPFRSWANAEFVLAREGRVSLKVYDIHGNQKLCIADNAELAAGHHVIPFGSQKLPQGTYTVRLITADGIRSSMMMRL